MGAFHSGALTVLITLNHLYPMKVAKTRNFTLLPVRGNSYSAVAGRLEAHVLVRNHKTTIASLIILEYREGSD